MSDEDTSQSTNPSSEPTPVAPVISTVQAEPTTPPPETPIQSEPATESPVEPIELVVQNELAPIVPNTLSDSSPDDQAESSLIQAEQPVNPSASSTPPPAASQTMVIPAVSQVAPQAPSAWNPHSAEELNYLKTVLGPKAWASHRLHMQANLEKVMELARKKKTIDRTDVRLHLEVSQATATRYLTELVHEGKLVRRHTQNENVYTVK